MRLSETREVTELGRCKARTLVTFCVPRFMEKLDSKYALEVGLRGTFLRLIPSEQETNKKVTSGPQTGTLVPLFRPAVVEWLYV